MLGPGDPIPEARVWAAPREAPVWLGHVLAGEPARLPPGEGPLPDRITDYLAGMTDRFALREYGRLFVPTLTPD